MPLAAAWLLLGSFRVCCQRNRAKRLQLNSLPAPARSETISCSVRCLSGRVAQMEHRAVLCAASGHSVRRGRFSGIQFRYVFSAKSALSSKLAAARFSPDRQPALKARFNAPVRGQSHTDWCRNEPPSPPGGLGLHEPPPRRAVQYRAPLALSKTQPPRPPAPKFKVCVPFLGNPPFAPPPLAPFWGRVVSGLLLRSCCLAAGGGWLLFFFLWG